jgi:hypothetical protein
MVKPWAWGRASNRRAVANARAAATELGRLRAEREAVARYLVERHEARTAAARPAQPA